MITKDKTFLCIILLRERKDKPPKSGENLQIKFLKRNLHLKMKKFQSSTTKGQVWWCTPSQNSESRKGQRSEFKANQGYIHSDALSQKTKIIKAQQQENKQHDQRLEIDG